jgi:hypothetical protein
MGSFLESFLWGTNENERESSFDERLAASLVNHRYQEAYVLIMGALQNPQITPNIEKFSSKTASDIYAVCGDETSPEGVWGVNSEVPEIRRIAEFLRTNAKKKRHEILAEGAKLFP